MPEEGVGSHYRRGRDRLNQLLDGRSDEEWITPVPACPGWRVRDVVAHLAGTVDDAMAGRLTGPPSDAQTAEQVERHRRDDPVSLLAHWNASAPPFEDALTAMEIWEAAIDVVSHEHDIRGALGEPGARDDESVRVAARLMVERLDLDATLSVDLGDETWTSPGKEGPELTLTTTPFEILRARLGRRAREQVRQLAWSGDPGGVLDDFFVFGPAAQPVIE